MRSNLFKVLLLCYRVAAAINGTYELLLLLLLLLLPVQCQIDPFNARSLKRFFLLKVGVVFASLGEIPRPQCARARARARAVLIRDVSMAECVGRRDLRARWQERIPLEAEGQEGRDEKCASGSRP